MRQPLRIFVSSPGDALRAREVAAQVIEKLAHEFARFFEIEPYMWEYEPMLASGHFQDSIDPPSLFDAVVLILESRLGTHLPERTALREYRGIDGRVPVTGTEWEYEDALAGARAHGLPDLLVYRSSRLAEIDTWDPHSRQAALSQIEALDGFWSRHFADQGSFIAGFGKYASLEEFSAKLEKDLRGCIQRRISQLTPAQRTTRVRFWAHEPFRGLEAYEFEHAPIFFGREEALGAALLRLITNAQAGRPFLLLLGASGSGKSSLAKAGLVPRLLVPQRVSATAFLRRVVFRASEAQSGEDLFDALARCLTEGDGEAIGLPELLSNSSSVAQLGAHLREAWQHPELPFTMVLDHLAESARQQGRVLRHEQGKLILVVDQLEEIFTSERVQSDERKRFIELLAALVRSGRIWIVATMRSDFWHRSAETPELVQLADRDGRMDLLPPTSSELSQMIRAPAEAAAIGFETDPVTGIPLPDRISEAAAAEPGALPLLSYLLNQLYRRDIEEGGGSTLTYATYEALGRLKGAIASRAEAVVDAQPELVQRALRDVLFALVQISPSAGSVERAVARRAPLADFPIGTPKRELVDALLAPTARLLIAEATSDVDASVRLAHEALIYEWRAARDYVASSAESLRIRRRLEERHARWQSLSKADIREPLRRPIWFARAMSRIGQLLSTEHGLLSDLDLTDGRRLLRDYRTELSPTLVQYIERSVAQYRWRRQRALRTAIATAAILGVLAVGAGYEAQLASHESARAEAEAATATATTDFLLDLFRVSDPSEAKGNQVTAREMLDKGSSRIATELARQPAVQARLSDTIGTAYMGLGLYEQAAALLARSLELRRVLAGSGQSLLLAQTLDHLADVQARRAEFATAERNFRECLQVSTPLTTREAGVLRATALHGLGAVLAQEGHTAEAEHDLRDALRLEDRLKMGFSDEAARTLQDLAKVLEDKGALTEAAGSLERAVRLHRSLHGTQPHPAYAEALNDLGDLDEQRGEHRAAQALFEEALEMKKRLYGDNHPEVAAGLVNLAIVANDEGEFARAQVLYRQALEMQRRALGPLHPDIAATLNDLAFVQSDLGDLAGAIASERESLSLYRQLFPQDHPDVARAANRLGLWLTEAGKLPEAERVLNEALNMRQRLLGPDHPDVASSLTHVAILGIARGEFASALASAERAAAIYGASAGAAWKIAIANGVAGGAMVGLGRLDEAGSRLAAALAVLSTPDSTAPAAYLHILQRYSQELVRKQTPAPGGQPRASRTIARN